LSTGSARALDEITVAYFLEWPSPNLAAKADGSFDEKMGVKVNWRAFGNGNEMSAATASGDVRVAYSQGLVPFVVGSPRACR
jgi:taurine transport system substrate-binding protein